MADWPHQTAGVRAVLDAIEGGCRRPVITSPTGGGKSRIMHRLIEAVGDVAVLCHRTALMEQLSIGLTDAGIDHGIVAPGYEQKWSAPVQLCMKQTLRSRLDSGRLGLPRVRLVMDDEAHADTADRTQRLQQQFLEAGAAFCGVTATPVGIGHLYDELIVAGRTSDLRRCGALVPAHTYAPDEPAIESLRKTKSQQFIAIEDQYVPVMRPVIFGRVLEHYHRLNADQRPSVLFAPDVEGSLWFAEQLTANGVPAAHIDSKQVWFAGQTRNADRDAREWLRRLAESGECKVVCNRFVLREGIDWPFIGHLIFACTFGSVCSYVQAGGRGLRAHPSLDRVTIQDHGGNYWRHDSLNADRIWRLEDTEQTIAARRREILRAKTEPEPIVCPQCAKVRPSGIVCQACGFSFAGRKRVVIQTDGKMREVTGDIYKPPRYATPTDKQIELWKRCVFGARKSGRTFSQARGLFAKESRGAEPGPNFPLLPKTPDTWLRPVRDVDFSTLS